MLKTSSKYWVVLIGLLLVFPPLKAQVCPTADFQVGSNFCLGQKIFPQNNSLNGNRYSWILCDNPLSTPATEADLLMANGIFNKSYALKVLPDESLLVYVKIDDPNTIYFVRLNDELTEAQSSYRRNFDSNVFSSPIGLDIVKHENDYIGFVASSASFNLTRLIWEDGDLNAVPSVDFISDPEFVTGLRSVEVVDMGDEYHVLVGSSQDKLYVLDFDSDLAGSPNVRTEVISDLSIVHGIASVYECGVLNTFITSSSTNELIRLEWSSGLANSPVASDMVVSDPNWTSPRKLSVSVSDGEYFVTVQVTNGYVFNLNFGNVLSSVFDIQKTNIYISSWGAMDMVKNSFGDFKLFASALSPTLGLYQLGFENSCSEEKTSSLFNPVFTLNEPGTYTMKLIVTDEEGDFSSAESEITVSSGTAPNIDLSVSDNQCFNQPNTFNAIHEGGGLTYDWSFDEDETSQNPSHTFASTGEQVVVLTVDDGSCQNTAVDTVTIYPVIDDADVGFTVVSNGANCSNTELNFFRTFDESSYQGANLTYNWNYNDEGSSTDRNGAFAFPDATDPSKDITLTVSIPGCSGTYSETINVIEGPAVEFELDNVCFGETQEFTNLSTQSGSSNLVRASWDLGDGNSSDFTGADVLNQVTNQYAAVGDYRVFLEMENEDGCISTLERDIFVNGIPEVAFEPSSACQGESIAFVDGSSPGDAVNNVSSWSWSFGEEGTSTEESPAFSFAEAGAYDVSLTVRNDAGCENTLVKSGFVISDSPQPVVSIEEGCLGTETEFNDMQSYSDGEVTFHRWQIEDALQFNASVNHVFEEQGEYPVSLIVEGSNGCQTIVQENVRVYEEPFADFSFDRLCENEITAFSDQSLAQNEEAPDIVSRTWNFGGLGESSELNPSFDFESVGEYNVSLTVMDDRGCRDEVTKQVSILEKPSASFEVSRNFGEPPLTVDYTNTSSGASAYVWKFNDSSNTTSSDVDAQFVYNELGEYSSELLAINDAGCRDSVSIDISAFLPELDLELINLTSREENGQTYFDLEVRNNSNVDVIGFDIMIQFDDDGPWLRESYEGQVDRQSTVNFTLSISLSSDESARSIQTQITPVIGEDLDLADNSARIDFDASLRFVRLQPNPSVDGDLTVSIDVPTVLPVVVSVVNSSGKTIYEREFVNLNIGRNNLEVLIPALRSGLYIVRTSYDGNSDSQRWVKY